MTRTSYLGACLIVILVAPVAWSQQQAHDPAAKPDSKPRDGFVDFALQQINPQNKDYGCQIDEARRLVVENTIKNSGAWAVMLALGFLVLSFCMLWHQHRERDRRELIAADFLAQYYNAWVDARMVADDAIQRYNQLVQAANSADEAATRRQFPEFQSLQSKPVTSAPTPAVRPQADQGAAPGAAVKAGGNGADRQDAASQKREPEPDLIAQVGTLQQQLLASHERERNLQAELGKARRRARSPQSADTNLRS